jgi:site-specific DNA-methyltransferase (adenine-specific)
MPTAFWQSTGRKRAALYRGDVREVLASLPTHSFHACLCDPPYELRFMGRAWDHSGVAFDPATWEVLARVVKPGGYLLAFGGTRTFHRLACAIEDAGFEIRDCIMWVYGQGFPKSLDVSKAIDKQAGHWRGRRGDVVIGNGSMSGPNYKRTGKGHAICAAAAFSGWGTALKPAWEPIIIARKPLDGTVADNVQEHAAGALNIDGCRVTGNNPSIGRRESARRSGKCGSDLHSVYRVKCGEAAYKKDLSQYVADRPGESLGRFPANLILQHHPLCRKVGTKRVKGAYFGGNEHGKVNRVFGVDKRPRPAAGYIDADGLETVDAYDCHPDCPMRFFPTTKSNKAGVSAVDQPGGWPGGMRDVFGYGDSGSAARFFYCAKTSRSERGEGNTHPCVKPLELCRYLATLLLPPAGVGLRRLIVPFSGSGSEMLGALAAGWDRVAGIEQSAEYLRIARRRLNNA